MVSLSVSAAPLLLLVVGCAAPAREAPPIAPAPSPGPAAVAASPSPAPMTGYTSAITLARQLPLGSGIPAFAHYMNDVHSRVHPWFADRYLQSLHRLPKDDPSNAPGLATTLEVAIGPDGRIAQMGVVTPSGAPPFDAAALESFARAAPFAPTAEAIRSADGNVWMQWELRRDEVFACSVIHARPFRLGP